MQGTALGELLVAPMGSDAPFGVCRWPALYECCQLPDEVGLSMRETLEDAATDLLFHLSGQQFGSCGVTLGLCRQDCSDGPSWGDPWTPYPYPARMPDGNWANLALACGGGCAGWCSCGPIERIGLPNPATHVTEVIIDGVMLEPSQYKLLNRLWLIRTDGGRWPSCNDLAASPGEVGFNSFKAFYGREVPVLGQLAAAEQVCEQFKACTGDKTCALPSNWVSMTRGGISISRPTSTFEPSARDLDVIPEQQMPMTRRFLRAFNPYSLQSPSTVWSPDIPTPTRVF